MKTLLTTMALLFSKASFASIIVTVTAIPNLNLSVKASSSAKASAAAVLTVAHTQYADHVSCSADTVSLQRPFTTSASASGQLSGIAYASAAGSAQLSGIANCMANGGSAGTGFGSGPITGYRTAQNQASVAFTGPITGQGQAQFETTLVSAKASDITAAGYSVDLQTCVLSKGETALSVTQAASVLHYVAGKSELP